MQCGNGIKFEMLVYPDHLWKWLKFRMLMYSAYLQNYLDFGYGLLIFLIFVMSVPWFCTGLWGLRGVTVIRSIDLLDDLYLVVSKTICTFSFQKIQLKMLSGKWRPFCPTLNVLKTYHWNNRPPWIHSMGDISGILQQRSAIYLYARCGVSQQTTMIYSSHAPHFCILLPISVGGQ